MSQLKTEIINGIIEIEGGFVDDPNDSGGATKYGITESVARECGYKGKMRNLSRSTAFKVYSEMYWDALSLDYIESLNDLLAREIADTGVNQGVRRAAKFLQRSLNVLNNGGKLYADIKADGQVGEKTIRALRRYLSLRGDEGVTVLFNMLNALQGAFYVTLAERREKDEKFIYGWFKHRVTINGED